jgi:hypothetical protein
MTYRWGCAVLVTLCLGVPLAAQEEAAQEEEPSLKPKLEFGFEAKAHYRDSDLNRFAVPFDFPPTFLPRGQTRGF